MRQTLLNTIQEFHIPTKCLQQPENAHRLSVAIVGPANAGKSTLLNCLLGRKLAIVSRQPQSTRDRLLAIVSEQGTDKSVQLLMYDTPGFVELAPSKRRIIPKMVHLAPWDALELCDKIVWMMDVRQAFINESIRDTFHVARLRDDFNKPVTLVFNKSDCLKSKEKEEWEVKLPQIEKTFASLLTRRQSIEKTFLISALNQTNVNELKHYLMESALPNDWIYAPNVVTDQHPVQLAQEAIRQQLFLNTFQEIPYTSRLELISFDDAEFKDTLSLAFEIHVDREGQKQVLLGKNSSLLQRMEQAAARELSTQLQSNIKLNLVVKVKKS